METAQIDQAFWMEVKIILAPEDYKFLKKEARKKAVMTSDLARQIVLRHIGNERGGMWSCK